MDFVNKGFEQITDLFRSMTPAARITSGLLLAVVLISLAYLVRTQATGGGDYLFGGREFSQSELADMAAAFGKAGLNDFEIDGYRMRIPIGQKAAYLAALADNNALPHDFARIFDETVVSSPFEPRYVFDQRLENVREKTLSLMISRMQGIELARVEYSSEEQRGLRRDKEIRAVAVVKPIGTAPLPADRIEAIRTLVRGSMAGLKAENVTVTDLNGGSYVGTEGDGVFGIPNSLFAKHKRYHEDEYRKKILEVLRDYPDVVVGVSVELNDTLSHTEQTQSFDSQKSANVQTRDVTKESISSDQARGGRPGAVPNGGSSNQSVTIDSTAGNESTLNETTSEVQSIPASTTVRVEKPGLTPNKVSVAIGVPSSYYAKLWKKHWIEQNPETDVATMPEPQLAELKNLQDDTEQNIKDLVVTLLPRRELGNDPYEHVTVKTVDTIPPEPIVGPTAVQTASGWLAGNWQAIGMMLLGVFGLVMLRGMLRSASDDPSDAEVPPEHQSQPHDDYHVVDESDDEDEVRLRFGSTGPNLRDELTQLVKEDPEAAAKVLKTWIGDAA